MGTVLFSVTNVLGKLTRRVGLTCFEGFAYHRLNSTARPFIFHIRRTP